MSKLKSTQQCRANVRNGDRCSRYCAVGETLCSVHQPNAKPSPIISAQDTDDPSVILRRLMKDRDPAIRIRAVNSYFDRLDKESCQGCASTKASSAANERIFHYSTDAQRAQFRELLAGIAALKADVLDYMTKGGAPNITEDPHFEPERPSTESTVAAPTPTVAKPKAPPAPEVYVLPRDQYEDCGLVQLENDEWTHALGDDHAAQILSGAITLDQAKADHANVAKKSDRQMSEPAQWHTAENTRRP